MGYDRPELSQRLMVPEFDDRPNDVTLYDTYEFAADPEGASVLLKLIACPYFPETYVGAT
jgi:hypothetical protein